MSHFTIETRRQKGSAYRSSRWHHFSAPAVPIIFLFDSSLIFQFLSRSLFPESESKHAKELMCKAS